MKQKDILIGVLFGALAYNFIKNKSTTPVIEETAGQSINRRRRRSTRTSYMAKHKTIR